MVKQYWQRRLVYFSNLLNLSWIYFDHTVIVKLEYLFLHKDEKYINKNVLNEIAKFLENKAACVLLSDGYNSKE